MCADPNKSDAAPEAQILDQFISLLSKGSVGKTVASEAYEIGRLHHPRSVRHAYVSSDPIQF